MIAVAVKEGSLYKLRGLIHTCSSESYVFSCKNSRKISAKEKWHRKLGHVNFKYLNLLCKDNLLEGGPQCLESPFMKCSICIHSKMSNLPFKNNRAKAKEILEIVHTDVNGPHKTTAYSGEKYFVSFLDDYIKLAEVYCIKSKDQVLDCFTEYYNEVCNLTRKTIKKLRLDNGKEYIFSNFYSFAKSKGIFLEPCPPYVHELNGSAERFNRSIMDTARCLLSEANIDLKY